MVGAALAAKHSPYLQAAAKEFSINTPARVSGFLANVLVETQGLTKLAENLNYTDPVRIAKIFRTAFDLDKDRVIDPEEIEFAKRYVRNPEALANRAYANRYGNGDEASGDGWRYRGSGYLHTTFQENYKKLSGPVGVDLAAYPDRLRTDPSVAARAAAAQWSMEGCNELMDAGKFESVIKKINPGMAGANERRAFYTRLQTVIK